MLNRVILIGRLTRDPELRYTGSGIPVATFSLAVDRPFTNQQGERDTDFIRIVTWRKLAETCANNIGKGRLVAIDGRLQVRNYEDREGNKRQAVEVVAETVRFLDWPKDRGSGSGGFRSDSGPGSGSSYNSNDDPFDDGGGFELPADDVPF